jgi:hypothetical protein
MSDDTKRQIHAMLGNDVTEIGIDGFIARCELRGDSDEEALTLARSVLMKLASADYYV